MELRQLRSFVAAADEGTFTRAAERVHVVQQAVSKQIAELERELGVLLFDRLPGGLRLTTAGEAFLPEARRTLAQLEQATELARAAGRATRAELRVGSVEQGFTTDLVHAARDVLQREGAPDGTPIHIEVVLLPTAQQKAALRAGRIDVATVHGPVPPEEGLSSERIADRSIEGVIIASTHRLAGSELLPASVLAEHPGATFPREWNPDAWDRVHAALSGLQADVRTDSALTSLQGVLAATATHGWWAPAPAAVAAWLPPTVVYRPVAGLSIPFFVEALWRSQGPSPAVRQFLQALRNAEARQQPPA